MKSKYFTILVICALVALVWLAYEVIYESRKDLVIRIAFVGPLSGAGVAEGRAYTQGIELYLDAINKKGGINGRKIVLDTYDDQNDAKIAKEKANEIIEKNKAVAVIGHHYSNCSISGGEVYKQFGIPAITPGATNVEVTQNNDWYFRTVFNDNLQGRFLANYLKKVLKQDSVTIIHEDRIYGAYLARVFEETAEEVGLEIKHEYNFEVKDKNLDNTLKNIVEDLQKHPEGGFVFLSMQAVEGSKLIRLMKDSGVQNSIIVPAAFISKAFLDSFDEFPKEKMQPGHYTDGIYITTPFIFDTASEKAQQFKDAFFDKFGESADLRSAFGYDSAMLIVKAIKETGITGEEATLRDDRKKIRDSLANINNISNGVEGVTGLIYFNQNREAQKSIFMGVLQNKNIISSLVQLQDVYNSNEITNLQKAIEDERVLMVDGRYMYKTNVVYVGVEINKITDFNIKDLTYTMDFYIWFRFQGEINPQNVDFLNAIEPIMLKSPLSVETVDKMTHRLYRVKEAFRADFKPNVNTIKEHVLGVYLHHRDLTRKNLIYVTDMVGMGLTDKRLSPVERLRRNQALNPLQGWSIRQTWFSQSVLQQTTLGSLKYLNAPGGVVEFSCFNVSVLISNLEFTIRRMLSPKTAEALTTFSAMVLLLLMIAFWHHKFKHFPKSIWFFQSIFAFLLLLASEVVAITWFTTEANTANLSMIIKLFDVLWWATPAVLLNFSAELFLWTPLEEKSGRTIPRIVRRFVSSTIYIMTFFGIVAFVYDQRLTSLLATSGVIAMIIGLAIQINISNIFSGIAINIEHPFRVGDWVKIGNFEEGKVVDVTWRTTRILTRMGCILSIPNSTASESAIHNFDYPDSTYWIKFIVHVHPMHPPQRVQKIIMDAVLSADAVLKTPEPFVIFVGLTEWAANYCVYFPVRDYTWQLLHEQCVWTRIWIHLNRAGIAPAIQRQEIHFFKGVKERGEEVATKPITLLQEIDIFRPFSQEAKEYLSAHIRRHRASAGEVIVRQGDAGNSLFILVEGVVGVRVRSKEGEIIEVARLGAGNFFGEMALLTGEERTATVVALTDTYLYEITKENIAGLMAEQPEVSELISKVLTQRQIMTQSQMNVRHDIEIEEEALYKRLLGKIENFFGLRPS